MKNIKDYLPTIILVIASAIIIHILLNKEPDRIYIEPKIIQELENQSTKEKEIIRETKLQVVKIENSEEYIKLRAELDSIMHRKDTSKYATEVCYQTVTIQDSIISKQKVVIDSQDKVITNDSIIKLHYKEVIDEQNKEIVKLDKKAKKNLWRGRGEGVVVGGVLGFVLGKSL